MRATESAIDVEAFIDRRRISSLQILVAALCALVVLLDGLNTQVIGYLGPALSKEWSIPRAALGPVFSAGLVGLMIGLLVSGPLSDRTGRKRVMIVSTALFGVFTLLTALARGVPDLYVYRVLAGIGLGGAMPNALALTGEYCPSRRRATVVVAMFCGFSLGSILGGGLTATVIEQYGWRMVFVVCGLIPLLTVPLLWTMLPESLHFLVRRGANAEVATLLTRLDPAFESNSAMQFTAGQRKFTGVPLALLFKDGRAAGTLLLWIVFFMNLLDYYFLQNWLPTLFTDAGLSTSTAVWISTLVSAGGIAAGILSGPLMDRFGGYSVLAVLYACGTVLVALIGTSIGASIVTLMLITFAAGFCVSGGQKSVNALAVIFYPAAMRSTGVGWALGVGRLGSIVGPLAGGWLIARGASNAALFQFAAIPMAVAAIFMTIMGVLYRTEAKK